MPSKEISQPATNTAQLLLAAQNLAQADPGHVRRVEHSAAQQLFSIDPDSLDLGRSAEVRADINTPVLTPPPPPSGAAADGGDAQDDPGGRGGLLKLMLELGEYVFTGQIDKLETRLKVIQDRSQGEQDALNALGEEYQAAVEEMNVAAGELGAANEALKDANQRLEEADKAVLEATDALAGMGPDDPGYAAAQAALDQAQAQQRAALGVRDQAMAGALKAADAVKAASARADGAMQQIVALGGRPQPDTLQRQLTGTGLVLLLMAQMIELIGENADAQMMGQLKLDVALMEKQQKKMMEEAAENEKTRAQQDAINKGVNCAMKIVGAVLTAVSVVSAAFTGGASLALAAVGLALLAVDKIVKETTGTGLFARVTKPLMDNVLKPMIELLSKGISQMLQKMGVPKEVAEQVGNIAGTVIGIIAVAVAVIAASVLAKNAAARIGDALSGKLGELAQKIIPEALRNFTSQAGAQVSSAMNRVFGGVMSDPAKVAELVANLDRLVAVTRLGQAGVQSGAEIAVGVFGWNAAQLKAEIDKLVRDMDLVKTLSAQELESFKSMTELLMRLMSGYSRDAETSYESRKQQVRAIGMVAA